MRFIVLGAGSIGRRHLRNLLSLGHACAAVFDPDPERLVALEGMLRSGELTTDESLALAQPADAVLVCSPPHCHTAQAQAALDHGLHVFVEKPLAEGEEGLEQLIATAQSRGLVGLVGCNLRFLPSLQRVKQLLDAGKIGRVLSARAHCGYYLPYWRPGTDYRTGYAARRETGGGIILDSVHELDYLTWTLGTACEVFAYAQRAGNLEIATEDNAEILLRFRPSAVANVHLDYLQRTYRRGCEWVGETGVIVWDYISQQVTVFGEADRQAELYLESINSDRNGMFLDELRHFVAGMEGREQPALDLAGGRQVLQVALAAHASAERHTPVSLNP